MLYRAPVEYTVRMYNITNFWYVQYNLHNMAFIFKFVLLFKKKLLDSFENVSSAL